MVVTCGVTSQEEIIIGFVTSRLPHFMAPRTVVFEDLPKTSTGKVHKSLLKDKAKAMGSLSENITISKL